MARKVAVNGLGRIGRLVLRELLEDDRFEVVAVNDIASMDTLAYLLKHSSERGPFGEGEDIYGEGGALCVGDSRIPAFQEADARRLPWRELGAELVLECSGAYTSSEKAQAHLDAGAKRVLISAAAGTDIPTIVCGINDSELDPGAAMVSGASCSTVGLSPLAAALDECAPILHGISTTIHALTPSQMVLDDAQRNGNLRRSRTASTNIIPTSAAAAKAVGLVIPHLNGKLSGSAIRVPVTKGSYITLYACVTEDELDAASLNAALKGWADGRPEFGYTEEELVSEDIANTRLESIFDGTQTKVSPAGEGTYMVEVATWFDNETSYVAHFVRLASLM